MHYTRNADLKTKEYECDAGNWYLHLFLQIQLNILSVSASPAVHPEATTGTAHSCKPLSFSHGTTSNQTLHCDAGNCQIHFNISSASPSLHTGEDQDLHMFHLSKEKPHTYISQRSKASTPLKKTYLSDAGEGLYACMYEKTQTVPYPQVTPYGVRIQLQPHTQEKVRVYLPT